MPIDEKKLVKAIKEFNHKRHLSYHAVEVEEELLSQFQSRWPKEKLEKILTIESYAIGAGDKDNFCYWIERRTKSLGSILGSPAKKFKVYYSKKNKKYECVKEFDSPQEAFRQTKKSIIDLLDAAGRNDAEAVKAISLFKTSNLVRGKILFLYYPDKYINIFSEEDIDFFLDQLRIGHSKNDHVIEKQQKLINFKNRHAEMKRWSNTKFGKFLYSDWVKPPSRVDQKSFKEKIQEHLNTQVTVDYFVLERYFNALKKYVEAIDKAPFRSFSRSKFMKSEEGYKDSLFMEAQLRLNTNSWMIGNVGNGDILNAVKSAIEQPKNNLLLHNNSKGEAAREDRLLYEVKGSPKKQAILEDVLYKFYRDEETIDEESFNELKALGATYPLIAYLFFIKNKNKYLSLAPINFDNVFKKLQITFSTYKKCSWGNYLQYLSIVSEVKIFLEEKLDEHVSLLDAHSFLWLLRKLDSDIKISDQDIEQVSIEELELEKFSAGPQEPDDFNFNQGPSDGPHDPGRYANNKLIGDTAEKYVVEREKSMLVKAGRSDLEKKVLHVAKTRDCGYDVLSFELDGMEKRIEVKGTSKPTLGGFFNITRNEVKQSKSRGNYNFYLYIVFNVNGEYKEMKIKFIKNPDFFDPELFKMKPTQYQVRYQPKSKL